MRDEKKKNPVSLIRTAITNGEFHPNQRLVETELASLFNTSRMNVREALAQLEFEGLIVSQRNRGASVRSVSEAEAVEIVQARAALEVLMSHEAALRANDKDKAKLKAIERQMRGAFEADDLIKYGNLNDIFHSEIHRIANHATASRILTNLKWQVIRYRFRAILYPGRAARSIVEHARILKAICDNKPLAAEKAMQEHLRGVIEAMRNAISVANKMPL